MGPSIPLLDTAVYGFTVGTMVGVLVATAYYHLTGDLQRWPLIVGYWALFGAAIAVLLPAIF